MKLPRFLPASIFGALLVCALAPAFAQDSQPAVPRGTNQAATAPGQQPAQAAGQESQAAAQQQQPDVPDTAVLIPWLKGLRFIDNVSKLQKNGATQVGVTFDGPNILYSPGVYQQLQAFIGKPLHQGDLKKIVKVVSDWYAQRNHPYVDVSFPEQDADNGIVQVLVTEFRAGQITVQGNNWFAASEIRSEINLKPGQRINALRLNNDLTYLNENDFRDVRIVLQPSQTAGATDLVIQTGDRLPFRFTAAYANNGTPATGRDRWSAGITWGNAFWLDQTLTYQFTSSGNFWFQPKNIFVDEGDANFAGHSGSYTIPLPWHDRLIFFGSYDQVRPDLGPHLGQVGTSWQGSMRYAIPISLPKWPVQEIQFGYDFKRSNNNLQFGGISISNTLTDIDQFVLTYGTVIDDPLGQTKFSNRMALSPSLFSPYNNDAAFQPSSTHNGVPFAKAFYFYNDISATRLTKLPWDMGALTRIEAQFSTANLLASERLGIGGVESVRGYDEYTASGSEGFIFSQEIRSPAFGLLSKLFGKDSINDKMQYFVFYDFGYVRERKEAPGTGGSYLASTGAGFQYALDRYLSVSLDYGFQLRTATGASRKSGQLELSISANN